MGDIHHGSRSRWNGRAVASPRRFERPSVLRRGLQEPSIEESPQGDRSAFGLRQGADSVAGISPHGNSGAVLLLTAPRNRKCEGGISAWLHYRVVSAGNGLPDSGRDRISAAPQYQFHDHLEKRG